MFGYILPYVRTLSDTDKQLYRRDYCGLCRMLSKCYGFRSRFLLRYDVTFLYAVLACFQAETNIRRCFCPARPFCPASCTGSDKNLEYCADISVLLAWWKLQDTVLDEGFWKSSGAKLLCLLYRRTYRRAQSRQQELDALIRTQLDALHKLEAGCCDSIDRTADCFAQILKAAAGELDGVERRVGEQMLYHVGRFLYIIDCLDDLPEDCKRDAYNPLRYRYQVVSGGLCEEDKQVLVATALQSAQMAQKALDLTPTRSHAAILENVFTCGMPVVARAVAAGVFRNKKNRRSL